MGSQKECLTNNSQVNYLLEQNVQKMKGTIRVDSKHTRCPACGKKFTLIHPKLGFGCHSSCHTLPKKFYIDLSVKEKDRTGKSKSRRIRIFSDEKGLPIDTYQRALDVQSNINYKLESGTFDINHYSKADARKFWVSTLLEEFHKEKQKVIAPSYRKAYKKHIERHKTFFADTDVREVRKRDIKNYVKWLENQDYRSNKISSKTVKNTLDNFKTFLIWLKEEVELISIVPPFPHIEVEEYHHTWFSQDEQREIIDVIKEEDRPIIMFMMLHGVRPGETRALKCKNIDLIHKSIHINSTFSGNELREKRKGKSKKSLAYTLPIHPETFEWLKERVENNHPEAFVFVNPRTGTPYSQNALKTIWDRVRAATNLSKKVRLYDATRHSVGSQLANSGESSFKIQNILGHTDIRTTEKYTHSNVNSLRTTISKLSLKKDNVVSIESVSNLSAKENKKS